MRVLSFQPLRLPLAAPLGLVIVLLLQVSPTVGCAGGCIASTSQDPITAPPLAAVEGDGGISLATRAYWMRQANLALPNPCPFAAFGSVVVNHTASAGLGEMVAIDNCSAIFVDPEGPFRMTPAEALAAFADLTLYTNAESCPMCASAIRWAGFKEYVYGTSIDTLVEKGWGQINVNSSYIFAQSTGLPRQTGLVGPVLTNETDVFFSWQYVPDAPCPQGCSRDRDQGSCRPA
ncbi:hypothetical protein LX32DRAFT_655215 [Colletotrichum zoysiae]|uniref:Cytidine and deoxycytidylate deaminase zinc-binding region n=1 Tax=Colletotrichum zoysiae TaxID=1216348 RepID=A0AAD9M1A9_9PEZI|nr:hypothetical protein LX32DRAFT_655215 [Colletotrichum zoysiae]